MIGGTTGRPGASVLARAHRAVVRQQFPRDGEEQHHRVVGDLRLAEVGVVRHHDTVLGRRSHIERVEADAVADDQFEARQLVEDSTRDLRTTDEDGLRVPQQRHALIHRGGPLDDDAAAGRLDDGALHLEPGGVIGFGLDGGKRACVGHGRE